MIRIIAGKHRSRQLELPADESVRPTTDKAREALFSILTHKLGSWDGVRVCDACCGTGAYGFEALSRGAEHATFIDSASASINLTKRNAVKLKEMENCTFAIADVTRPPPAVAPCHLLLLDPPYHKGLAEAGLAALTKAGWAAPAALAAIEVGRDEAFSAPEGWQILAERNHGAARLVILERQ